MFVTDCGAPVIPSNATVSCLSSTTEGATLTIQCEEGLVPSHPINITCTSISGAGQWMPDQGAVKMVRTSDISHVILLTFYSA
jgi:hypothetical protein